MRILLDGEPMEVEEGTSVAAALLNAGVLGFRESVSGEPRGPLCGMGICYECRARVDGVDHERTCLMSCREGMEVETAEEGRGARVAGGGPREVLSCDVLVVGAGPAGLAAVGASSKHFDVVMVDENPTVGGQIWRQMGQVADTHADRWMAQIFKRRVRILAPGSVFDLLGEDRAMVKHGARTIQVKFGKMVLATGARELFLPFPGWTLPGVYGVGGLQALVKQGMPIREKRVVVAGSGPLLLAVAKHLRQSGAKIDAICEQAPPRNVQVLALALWRYPRKILQALSFFGTARKLLPGWWVESAEGEEHVRRVRITDGTRTRTIECDYLACAYGLVPNLELAKLAGCRIVNGFVSVDDDQRTSEPRVFAAGEIVEIGGVEAAIVQGSIAGLAAAGSHAVARLYHRSRAKCHAFAAVLAKAYALRPEVLNLAEGETPVCRCEDVRWEALKGKSGFREAKLHTRLGMGPCQGRVCGAACRALFGWEEPSVRPPVVPVPLGAVVRDED